MAAIILFRKKRQVKKFSLAFLLQPCYNTSMKVKLTALLLAAAVCLMCVPLFAGCSADVAFTLGTDGDGNKYYTVSGSGYLSSLKGEYEIPSYFGEGEDYAPVTAIAQSAFAGSSLTKVTIPDTVTEIGSAAFSYCHKLREVAFSGECKLEYLAQGMFAYCTSLQEITVPDSVTVIGPLCFYECSYLSSVTLPEGLLKIRYEAFENCSSLTEISLPSTLIMIGYLAFYNAGLTYIIIPDSVHSYTETVTGDDGTETEGTVEGIGMGAFHTCTSLKYAVIGSGVTNITSGAFGYCTALEYIYLPASLESVEGATYTTDGSLYCGHAFHNNDALTDVYYAGTAAEWETLKGNIVSDSYTYNGATYSNDALLSATVHCGSVYVG